MAGLLAGSDEPRPAWLRLIVSDAHEGLKQAVTEAFPRASWQRCRVHFMRSMLAHVSKRYQPMVSALLKTIFAQPTLEEARRELRSVVDALQPKFPDVAKLVEEAEDEVLTYMSFPPEHWRKLHSTNMLERLMRTLKARTRVVSIFPDEKSLERLVGAILIEENEEWMEARRYISEASMAKLDAARPQLPPQGELGLFFGQFSQSGDDDTIVARMRLVRVVAPADAESCTSLADAHLELTDHVRDELFSLNRPQSFFSMMSFRAMFSRLKSANICLSLRFSASRSFIRSMSDASMPPYLDFHL